jgi:hypothetical protein
VATAEEATCQSTPHQRQRAKASYRRRRQDPAELARMREADRTRKRASRARRKALGARSEAQLAKSRATAARRLIATHLDEYRALLEAERRQLGAGAASGGGPDAA